MCEEFGRVLRKKSKIKNKGYFLIFFGVYKLLHNINTVKQPIFLVEKQYHYYNYNYFQLIFGIFLVFWTQKRSVDALSEWYKSIRFDLWLIIAEDFETNKFLLVALFGLMLALGFAFSFDDDENKDFTTIKKKKNFERFAVSNIFNESSDCFRVQGL